MGTSVLPQWNKNRRSSRQIGHSTAVMKDLAALPKSIEEKSELFRIWRLIWGLNNETGQEVHLYHWSHRWYHQIQLELFSWSTNRLKQTYFGHFSEKTQCTGIGHKMFWNTLGNMMHHSITTTANKPLRSLKAQAESKVQKEAPASKNTEEQMNMKKYTVLQKQNLLVSWVLIQILVK